MRNTLLRTYHVRDAQGNILSTYNLTLSEFVNFREIKQTELSLYGSSRLGLRQLDRKISGGLPEPVPFQKQRTRRQTHYELSNHLGNILVSLSDKKFFNTTENRWSAEHHGYSDYYPFGLAISDRSYNSEGYRYGFNGKENDADFGMAGGIQDYGFRLYNPAMGRFLSVDPLAKGYPELTPYQFASNTPIWAIDLDGLEAVPYSFEKKFRTGEYTSLLKNDNFGLSLTTPQGIYFGYFNKVVTVEQVSGANKIYDNFQVDGPGQISLIWDMDTKDRYHVMSMMFSGWTRQINSASTEIAHNEHIKNDSKHSIYYHITSQLREGKVLPDLEEKLGSHILNTFRHQLWTSISTILYGEDFAKNIGDRHERESDGFLKAKDKSDSVVDLINNAWGRKAGVELSSEYKKLDLGDEKKLAGFLNQIAKRISRDIPEVKYIKFNQNDESVKKLAQKIRLSIKIDSPE